MTDQKERVREAYDELAETHYAERSGEPAEATLLEEIRARCDEGARVLDAGCGQGTPVASRLSAGYDVVGLDFSAEQLGLAADVAPRAALVQGDMTALAFAADSFAAVCAYHSIIHVPVDEHSDAIAEFARVLRPGGLLLLSSGGTEWEGSNPDWLDSGVEMEWSFPAPDETRAMLEDAGFDVLEWWIVTDTLGEDADSEVLDPEQVGDCDEPAGKPFFLARL